MSPFQRAFDRIILGDDPKDWGNFLNPDYALALEAAKMATNCADPTNIQVNETLAEAYSKNGVPAAAVFYQKRVVDAYENDKTIPWPATTKAEANSKLGAYVAAVQRMQAIPLK